MKALKRMRRDYKKATIKIYVAYSLSAMENMNLVTFTHRAANQVLDGLLLTPS
uniref:Uncharacterized protein n=1 Tax=Rhizophora mucronata TaxID=61149 RepID=A0A2P2Q8P0_RHIMU